MTDRPDKHRQGTLSHPYQQMYHRALGGWASQVLAWRAGKGRIGWIEPGAMDSHANRDWQQLYQCSVLDD